MENRPEQADNYEATTGKTLRVLATIALLLAILGAAAYLRLVGVDWDENQHLHPDERFLTMVGSDMTPVGSLAEYFDTNRSTLNPNNIGHGFFVYGDLPIILVRYAGEAVRMTSYYDLHLVGRVVSALADLLTLLLLFFIGRRLFDWRIGLLAAALYAAAALPIQLSHFYTVDTLTSLFATAGFLFIVRVLNRHRWVDYPLAGITLGLAIASKISIAPLAGILMLALALRVLRESRPEPQEDTGQDALSAPPARPTIKALIMRAAAGLAIAGLVTVVVFRIAQPYAFLPPNAAEPIDEADLGPIMTLASRIGNPIGMRPNPAWLSQMRSIQTQMSGSWDAPPNHQWAHRLPLVFPWVNMVRVGMGWPLGIWCWLALAWGIWEIVRRHQGSEQLILPIVWIVVLFAWQGAAWVSTMRYFLSLYPLLVLLGAWALVTLGDRIGALLAARGASPWHWSRLAGLGLVGVVLLSAYGWGFAVSRIYTRPVTRIEASRWIFENVPSDVTLLLDTASGPREFQLGLPNNWLPSDPSANDTTRPRLAYTSLTGGAAHTFPVHLPFDGLLTGIRFNHIADPDGAGAERTVRVTLSAGSGAPIAEGRISADFGTGDDPQSGQHLVRVEPVTLSGGQVYQLEIEPDDQGPLSLFGANIAVEGAWDDPLPLSLAPYNVWGAQYQGYEIEMAWEDIPEKRERMAHILDQVDYIFISSNRFYASLPRNPQRFPLSVAYYRALFNGDLGFDLVGDFTSRPNLGPIRFVDDTAEEAWTVYDHPRVLIFRKADRYSSEQAAAILGSVDLTQVVQNVANRAAGPPVVLHPPRLNRDAATPESAVGDTAGSTAERTSFWVRFQPITLVMWWLLIFLIGWAGFPTLYVLMPGLADRSYPLSRMFSLLAAAWVSWMLARSNIVPWGSWSAIIGLAATAALSAALVYPRRHEFLAWLRARRRHLTFIEIMLAVLFIAFVLIRLGNPDLWHPSKGGEKPMDMAYFNAVLKSQTFPPYNPWFAGNIMEYYYFGFVIVGLPLKLLPIPLTLAYNLILPTLFALTGAGAFSVAYNLLASARAGAPPSPPDEASAGHAEVEHPPTLWEALRAWPRISWGDVVTALRGHTTSGAQTNAWLPIIAGIAALLLTAVLGNLDQIRTLLWGLAELGSGGPHWASQALPNPGNVLEGLRLAVGEGRLLPIYVDEWYWNATRLIPITNGSVVSGFEITEFPFFTFLYADLHAHMIAMPLTLLVLVWCVAAVRRAALDVSERGGLWLSLLNIACGALIIGSLRSTNTWDWPPYLALALVVLVLAHFGARKAESAVPALGIAAIGAASVAGLAYAFITSSNPTINLMANRTALLAVLGGALVGLLAGFALGQVLTRPRPSASAEPTSRLSNWVTLLGATVQAGVLAAGSFLLFPPYVLAYRTGYTSFVLWEGSRTPLWAYIDIWGLFLFLIVSWMAWETWQWVNDMRQDALDRARLLPIMIAGASCLGITVLGITIVATLQDCPVAALALPLILWAVGLFFRTGQAIEKRVVLAILTLALALTLMVEVIVLQGDNGRMNTVFKFYVQVWILMAAAAGATLGWLWPAANRARLSIRIPWIAALLILVFLAALYPLLATRAKIADRWSDDAPHTLDGMAYMPYVERYENGVVFSLKPDYHALRWLQDNVQGTPTILEAHAVEYNWGNRVSVYTGLPAVIGWNYHQRQQHTGQHDEIWKRVDDVKRLYDTTDVDFALSLLNHYQVDLIMVGDLERAYYAPSGLEKFRTMAELGYLKVVYSRDNTVIYEVVGDEA